MKYDEFAFFNQQLAMMLRDGIPLEGALKRLCQEMRRSGLRDELLTLESDLARGTPLAEALPPRQLPELYKRMVMVGVKSGDLPGALTMLADYFQRQSNIWTRLKSLLVYPLIVIVVAFVISGVLAGMWSFVIGPAMTDMFSGMNMKLPAFTEFALGSLGNIWIFPILQGLLLCLALAVLLLPSWRGKLLWRLPAFKEASVSRVAGAMNLLLNHGVSLPDSLELVRQLETNVNAATDLGRWRDNVAAGLTKFSEVAAASKMFPPMFVWVVANAGEDMAGGFSRAAEIYQARAYYRTEIALYSVLPIAAVFLGAVVLAMAFLVISMFLPLIAMISNMTGN